MMSLPQILVPKDRAHLFNRFDSVLRGLNLDFPAELEDPGEEGGAEGDLGG